MDQERSLTLDEAECFLAKIGVTGYQSKFQSNRMTLLQDIIVGFQNTVPWSNIPLLNEAKKERHVPSWEEMKRDVMALHGGLCHTLNTFMYALLRAVGYDAMTVLGTVAVNGEMPTVDTNHDHLIVIVKHLAIAGSMFLVDVGYGNPIFDAIPMNFDKETSVYNHSFTTYKYCKENGWIIRKRLKTSEAETEHLTDIHEEQWSVGYIFKLEPCSHSEASEVMRDVYQYSDDGIFHTAIRGIIFQHAKALGFKVESRDVILRMIANPGEAKLTATTVPSTGQMENYISEIFPYVPREMIDNVFKTFLN